MRNKQIYFHFIYNPMSKAVFQSLYDSSPIWLQHALCSVEGYRINQLRYNTGFKDILTQVLAIDSLSENELIQIRNNRLKAFLLTVAKSPFYRSKIKTGFAEQVHAGEVIDALTSLPILTKAEVKANVNDIQNLN